MEEDQEVKQHVCKFCSKCFPCGRSLGGHMRSHVIVTNETEEKIGNSTTTKKKVSSLKGSDGGYGLREKPKKTWRLTDHSGKEDSLVVLDKLCKECGKGFHSWKALFGHMKCHSEKERERERESLNNNNNLDDQDSSSSQKMVLLDTQSDNEATAPNRRRRSKRRRTRYITPSTTSSVSFVSETQEQEQEEVAMSLMMLSRDLTPWCGFNSFVHSSVNDSLHFQPPSNLISKVDEVNNKLISNGFQMPIKVTKPSEFVNSVASNLNSKGKKSSQLFSTESAGNEFGVNRNKVSVNGKEKKPDLDSEFAFEDNGNENNSNSKYTSIKAKFLDSELKSSSFKSWGNKPSEVEFSKNSNNKRGKFECTTCNKVFHSYQALGGHRASHKKIKGCFASKNESSDNSTELLEAELSPANPTTTESSKLMKKNNTVDDQNEYVEEHEMVTISTTTGFDNEVDTMRESKKIKGHECPICFKVFPSGQALGGHKRSHLAGGSENTRNWQTQTAVLEEAAPEIRDLFDLNIPATAEEESSSHVHAEPYRPWWVVGGNPKQEALVGLMSNY